MRGVDEVAEVLTADGLNFPGQRAGSSQLGLCRCSGCSRYRRDVNVSIYHRRQHFTEASTHQYSLSTQTFGINTQKTHQ